MVRGRASYGGREGKKWWEVGHDMFEWPGRHEVVGGRVVYGGREGMIWWEGENDMLGGSA